MINTHKIISFGFEPYIMWELDILPIDILKAQRIRHTKVRTDIQHAHLWLPQFCPIAFAVKRTGRFADVRVSKQRIATSSAQHFHLDVDAVKIIKLWDSGQSIDPCTIFLYQMLTDEQIAQV
ncbi:MAG: hypothetical protein H6641_16100 [Caldilineaceae bacterium]|nr:hypothetical protein [Caldilineaceae bacterium]